MHSEPYVLAEGFLFLPLPHLISDQFFMPSTSVLQSDLWLSSGTSTLKPRSQMLFQKEHIQPEKGIT